MEFASEIFDTILDSRKLIQVGGIFLIMLIIYLETGVFFGFFLPGDVLLFTAGILSGTRDLDVSIFILLPAVIVAATAGNFTGYFFGKWAGKKLYRRKDSFFFRKSHLEKARLFFTKYGAGSLIVGRFLPMVRTFIPIFAGAIVLDLKKFALFNFIGAILWTCTLVPLGYFFGRQYPEIIDYIEYILLGFLVLTSLILLREYLKLRNSKKRAPIVKKRSGTRKRVKPAQ